VSRIVKHVAELTFNKNAATIGKLTCRLFLIPVGVEPRPALLDYWKRRRGSNYLLLACRGMHLEMFNATRYWKA
jgi:hypothetical protein